MFSGRGSLQTGPILCVCVELHWSHADMIYVAGENVGFNLLVAVAVAVAASSSRVSGVSS